MIIQYANLALTELASQVKLIQQEPTQLLYHREGIRIIRQFIKKLKEKVTTEGFINTANEIIFFKEVKPKFFGKLIYHAEMYNMELKKPIGNP